MAPGAAAAPAKAKAVTKAGKAAPPAAKKMRAVATAAKKSAPAAKRGAAKVEREREIRDREGWGTGVVVVVGGAPCQAHARPTRASSGMARSREG